MKLADRLMMLALAGVLIAGGRGGVSCDLPDIIPDIVTPAQGSRDVVIVRDSLKDTPAYARLWVALRTGAAERFFVDGKHYLTLIEPGEGSDLEKSLKPEYEGQTLPFLVIVDSASRKVLAKQPLTEATTADNVTEYVRRTGG